MYLPKLPAIEYASEEVCIKGPHDILCHLQVNGHNKEALPNEMDEAKLENHYYYVGGKTVKFISIKVILNFQGLNTPLNMLVLACISLY